MREYSISILGKGETLAFEVSRKSFGVFYESNVEEAHTGFLNCYNAIVTDYNNEPIDE